MTEPMPPPEEPMPDQSRARIRERLMAAAQARPPGPGRWAVPVAVAASVVLVAGLTAWAVRLDDDPDGSDGQVPATSTSASASPDAPSEPTESSTATPTDPPGSDGPAAVDGCTTELKHVLKGAEQAFVFPEAGGGTSFWVRGQQFSLCDERADTVTVHKPLPIEPDLDDVATFRVSSIYAPTAGGYRTVRVAGGIVPEGALAFDVAYTFPDGHTENATKATDERGRTWWRMVYAYDDGGGDEREKPPIEVSVTLSGTGFGFTLAWGTDTCAQANHGC